MILKLPYIESKTAFEDTYKKFKEMDLSEKTKVYFEEKFSTKDLWAFAYRKNLPCLRVKTTSRIEGLNSLIKESLSLSSRLCEVFYRMLQMHNNIMNKPYPSSTKINDSVLKGLENMTILKDLKGSLSDWAYRECASNFSTNWNFITKKVRRNYIITDKETNYEITLSKASPIHCICSYYTTMGLPCNHLFALVRDYPDSLNLLETVRNRWLSSHLALQFEDSQLFLHLKNHLLEKLKSSKYFLSF